MHINADICISTGERSPVSPRFQNVGKPCVLRTEWKLLTVPADWPPGMYGTPAKVLYKFILTPPQTGRTAMLLANSQV